MSLITSDDITRCHASLLITGDRQHIDVFYDFAYFRVTYCSLHVAVNTNKYAHHMIIAILNNSRMNSIYDY